MKQKVANTISIPELVKIFSTETKAVKWIEKVIWGKKPICPKCQGIDKVKAYKPRMHNYYCNRCRRAFTIKTDTVMKGSPLPIKYWAIAIYVVVTARKGISSLQLSKELGVTQKSAWFMLQRVREGCKQGAFKLFGKVEIDETYVGGKEGNKHRSKQLNVGGGVVGKSAILGMRQRKGEIRAMVIPNTTKETLHPIIHNNVRVGSTIYTDDNPSYTGAYRRHKVVNHSAKEYVNSLCHTNSIESAWALLKRGLTGTYHNVSVKHLPRYIDEFVFRLNEGNCQVDTIDRMQALARGFGGKRLSYKDLVK